jgi:hypothetical protein
LYKYFTVERNTSLHEFCRVEDISSATRKQIQRIINKHSTLKELQGKQGLEENRNQAQTIINNNLPGPPITAANFRPAYTDAKLFTPKNIRDEAAKAITLPSLE